jgi:K+-sensing histidine kinase KdpD
MAHSPTTSARAALLPFPRSVERSPTASFGHAGDTRAPSVTAALHRGLNPERGSVLKVTAHDAMVGLIAFAYRNGFTHVVFGERHTSIRQILFRRSALEKFVSDVPGTPVHVVPLPLRRHPMGVQFPTLSTRAFSVAALACSVMISLLALLPWEVAFGIAVASAIAWCIWLEHETPGEE